MALPVLAYFFGAPTYPFVLVLVLVIVIVIEKTSGDNHKEHSPARMPDHDTGGYILTTSLHVNPYYYPSESCFFAKVLCVLCVLCG